MPLKPSEIFVQECLLKHLDCGRKDSMEGEDPPDIYIIHNGTKTAVEITTLSPITFDVNGKTTNMNTEDFFGLNICKELKEYFQKLIPKDVSLTIVIYVPVINPRKYKSILKDVVKEVLSTKLVPGSNFKRKTMETEVEFFVNESQNYEQNKLNCLVLNNNSDADILKNAKIILENSINEKVVKCSKNIKDNYWLALLNDYCLANHKTYKRVFSELKIHHIFDRIMIINRDRSVYDLIVKT